MTKSMLDMANTQPAIFLISYSFNVAKKEFGSI